MIQEGTLKVFATTAFIFTFLYTGAPVNAFSYQATTYIRIILLVFSIAVSTFVFLKNRSVSRNATFTFLIILLFSIYHFPRFEISHDFGEDFYKQVKFFAAAISVAYLSSATQFSDKVKIYDLAIGLVLLYLALLIGSSAVAFDGYVPVILFSPIPGMDTGASTYSQGVSKIFLVAVIAFVFKLVNENIRFNYGVCMVIAAAFLFILSLAGGSRGEVIAGAITVIVVLSRNWKSFFVALAVLGSLTLIMSLAFEVLVYLEKLPSIWRLLHAYETATLGERDVLFLESMSLLSENPRCVLFGCGLSYFQEYYGYEYGRYPHNWAAEFIISFGAFTFIAAAVLVFLFFLNNYKKFSVNEKFLTVLSLYFLLISLKSGSLVGDALLYGSFFPVLFSIREYGIARAEPAKSVPQT